MAVFLVMFVGLFARMGEANAAVEVSEALVQPSASKIFAMLFLMLGPFKVLVPFVDLTKAMERRAQIGMAAGGIAIAAIMLAIAGLVGLKLLENFDIDIPVLAMTGGLILFLTALQTVLSQGRLVERQVTPIPGYQRSAAITPLAFPIIVTPYGLAAVIVFVGLARGDPLLWAAIAAIVAIILIIDWIAMIFAAQVLARFAAALQIVAVILGVVQTALGLQIIFRSLALMGLFDGTGA